MGDSHSSKLPLEVAARTISGQTLEAFKVLSNNTRLAILLALWEATAPGSTLPKTAVPAVSFSELQERVGLRDSGQFNYHLDRLKGRFVRQTDEGYTLTTTGHQILSAVFAGTLTDSPTFEDELIDAECPRCGAPVVIDYSDGILTERCTSCAGLWQGPGDQPGVLTQRDRPPVGLANRTPQEFERTGNTWDRHRWQSMVEGVCPACSGTVTGTIHVCETHETSNETICEDCESIFKIQSIFVCDICKHHTRGPAWLPVLTEGTVRAFFHKHGLNPDALLDEFSWNILGDVITEGEVRQEVPLEIRVTVELDGDFLEVILDDEARILDVAEGSS